MAPKITWKWILKLRSTQERAKSRLRGQLEANLRPTWPQKEPKLSSTWAKFWRSWARKLNLTKTLIFHMGNHDFAGSGASNKRCKVDARGQLGRTRAIFVQLGTALAPSWPNLEPTWGQLEPSWGQLGANLEPTLANLGINLGIYGLYWVMLAPIWASLAQFQPT